jgi:hypothetical protein
MNKIFSAVLCLFIFMNVNFAQQNFQFYVHLGNFSNPTYNDFSKISHLGFLHAKKTDATHADVFLLGFETREKAEEALANIKRLGFIKADLASKDISKGSAKYYVQLGSIEKNKQVNWSKFEAVPSLFAFPQTEVLKIVAGPFRTLEEARKELELLKSKGFSDAFARELNEMATFPIGAFESNQVLYDVKKNTLNALSIKGESPSVTTEDATSFWPPKTMDAKIGATPNILSTLKRTSVLSLQKILKSENYYPGVLSGYYNDATRVSFENALKNLPEMKSFTSKNEVKTGTSVELDKLSSIVDRLPEINDPFVAVNKFSDPLAKAYSAYLTFLKNGAGKEVDLKMNAAIRGAFSGLSKSPSNMPFFDFKAVYSYPNIEQLILHLFYIHSTPDNTIPTPCWLFNAHSKETQAAVNRFNDAKVKNPAISGCDYAMDWQDFRLLNNIMVYLGGKQPDQQELFQAAEERAFLYNSSQALDAASSKSVLQWEVQIWEKLELWGKKDPINIRMLTALKIAYFQSFIRIEDHFLQKGMVGADAKNMATAVIATVMTPYLDRFMQ